MNLALAGAIALIRQHPARQLSLVVWFGFGERLPWSQRLHLGD